MPLKPLLRPLWLSAARHAARAYVAGDTVADAVKVCRRWRARRVLTTIGYWNDSAETPERVARECTASLIALERQVPEGYLSLKLGALAYRRDLLDPLLARASADAFRVHFDSLGPETVDRTNVEIERATRLHTDLGCTLPGRWRRSVGDVDWAAKHDLAVRVVKGQWQDPDAPDLDPRDGYYAVVDALAGRARTVAVATHDLPLARRCLERLKAAGTPADLELLHGLPMRTLLRLGARLGVPVRVYVPYGASWLPYSMEFLKKRPQTVLWMVGDLLGG